MYMTPQNVSTEMATDVLVDFIREHCRKETMKELAKAARFRTSFFAPAKKVRLFEEVFFLHAALALASVDQTTSDRPTKVYLRTLFQYKVRQKIGALIGQDDPSFGTRQSAHMKSYSSILVNGGDEIGLVSTFLQHLHLSSDRSLDLQASMELLPHLLAARNLINLFSSVDCVQQGANVD